VAGVRSLVSALRPRGTLRSSRSEGPTVTYIADPRVDAYIDALPDWQATPRGVLLAAPVTTGI
jgi:hypothetical protein